MQQLDTVASPEMFRTEKVPSAPAKVDRKANIIFGASLMQTGDINDSRPWSVDAKTLAQAEQFANRSKNGMKARFTHPNMSTDGMGSYLGRWKNVRVDGDTLRGDLHIADAAFRSPQGDLGNYVMDLAESDPEAFGVSLATKLDMQDLASFEDQQAEQQRTARRNGDAAPEQQKWPMRFADVRAADVVDEPAATRGGLFDLMTPDLRNLPAQATALLSTYFGDSPEDIVRGRINAFLDRYFSNREEPEMAETTEATKTTTETQPEAAVTETTVVETSAAGTVETEVQTTATTDFAAVERERCKKIRALCELAGVPEKFNTFVDNNFSVEETQQALKNIVAKKNQTLSEVPDANEVQVDKDKDVKAQFSELEKAGMTFGMTEAEYVQFAKR